ncbi:MAG: hypothetical protein PHE32_04130 [Candidatus Shapirobacteria bacterium]|nr:hypothetical protein [Candidatus Shapirobacteria bacterium]
MFSTNVINKTIDFDGEFKSYLSTGVYECVIKKIEFVNEDKSYYLLTVEAQGIEETVRMYVHTDGCAEITLKTLKGLVIHQYESEDKKIKARETFDSNLTNKEEELLNYLTLELTNAKGYLVIKKSDRSFTRDDGSTGFYNNKSVLPYAPVLKDYELQTEEKVEDIVIPDNGSESTPF